MIMRGIRPLFVGLIAVAAFVVPALAADVPVRKNIDDLTATELAAYEHAIQILKDRSAANSYDEAGYQWQAWIHNCPQILRSTSGTGTHSDFCDPPWQTPAAGEERSHPGICEHHKDLFFSWHRAQFYYFEQILRATDPDGTVTDSRGMTGPSTANLAIPYWNWTQPPSGTRYPKALEDPNSPLYHKNRIHTKPDLSPGSYFGQITSASAISALINNPNFEEFGGYPQEAPTGGGGHFEYDHHDPMHSSYFGGDMASPSTAALDPGFFQFHSFIDLIFEQWIQRHGGGGVTSPKHFLRATQPTSVTPAPGHTNGAGVPNMGQVDIYLDIGTLGYSYEIGPDEMFLAPEAVTALLSAEDGSPALFGVSPRSPHAILSGGDGLYPVSVVPPTLIATIDVVVPAEGDPVPVGRFSRAPDQPDDSFGVDYFLTPKDLDFDPADEAMREKYIVNTRGYWGTGDAGGGHHGGHQGTGLSPLFLPMADALADLETEGEVGKTYVLTAVFGGLPPTPNFGVLETVMATEN